MNFIRGIRSNVDFDNHILLIRFHPPDFCSTQNVNNKNLLPKIHQPKLIFVLNFQVLTPANNHTHLYSSPHTLTYGWRMCTRKMLNHPLKFSSKICRKDRRSIFSTKSNSFVGPTRARKPLNA